MCHVVSGFRALRRPSLGRYSPVAAAFRPDYPSPMEILYLATGGPADPTRASIPWHLAVNGSIEAGQTARIVLAGDAAGLVMASARQGVAGVGVPPLADLVTKAIDRSVPIHV
jgi:predicted peroxiredoxin